MAHAPNPYRGFRYPAKGIQHLAAAAVLALPDMRNGRHMPDKHVAVPNLHRSRAAAGCCVMAAAILPPAPRSLATNISTRIALGGFLLLLGTAPSFAQGAYQTPPAPNSSQSMPQPPDSAPPGARTLMAGSTGMQPEPAPAAPSSR